jgi:hypothetical protein
VASLGPSTGGLLGGSQVFRRAGRTAAGASTGINDFMDAANDIYAMSARFLAANKESAEKLTVIIAEHLKAAIPDGGQFEYSNGRLRAAMGIYTPEDIEDEKILARHEEWASEVGAGDFETEEVEGDYQEERVWLDMGAMRRIRRHKAVIWAAEAGTFLPYAALVNDGGSMMIQPYGNPNARPEEAHWEPTNYLEKAVSSLEADPRVYAIIVGNVNAFLSVRKRIK